MTVHVQLFALILVANLLLCKSDDLLGLKAYCGLQHIDDYHRDTYNIALTEFPWLAQLLYDEDKILNGVGSLINRRYVLSAAHSIMHRTIYLTAVRLGDYDITTDKDCTNHTTFGEECSDPVQEFGIEKRIVHPEYEAWSSLNDIGLIRLSRNVEYSEYIRPICLPGSATFKLKEEEELSVSGWGAVDYRGNPTNMKKKLSGNLVSLEKCFSIYNGSRKPVTENNLCVLENRQTCQGDSGGPLMKPIKSQWYQVGILSFGKICNLNVPAVYVKVTNYLGWIKENALA